MEVKFKSLNMDYQKKYKIIKLVLNCEESITGIFKRNSINKVILKRWVKTYHKFGINSLILKKKPGNLLIKYPTVFLTIYLILTM